MTALENAQQAVTRAEMDSRTLEVVAAVLAAQQAQQAQQAAPVPAQRQRPAVHISGGAVVAGVAAVAVVGTVLTSLLLAVAITGCSVAVVAVVLRAILRDMRRH